MNQNQDQLESQLIQLGDELRRHPSIAESVMQQLYDESTDGETAQQPSIPAVNVTVRSQTWKWFMRSTIGLATSALAIGALCYVFLFSPSKSLAWSDVLTAMQKADSAHCVVKQQTDDGWKTWFEFWYDQKQGIVEHRFVNGHQEQRIDNGTFQWRFRSGEKVATRTQSVNTEGMLRRFLEPLKVANEFQRTPQDDVEIGTVSCKCYRTVSEKGDERVQLWIDVDGRLRRVSQSKKVNTRWSDFIQGDADYNQPIHAQRFQPTFGEDVQVVDLSDQFRRRFSLMQAVHHESKHGFEFAVHDLRRLENHSFFSLYSFRPTDETRRTLQLEEGLKYGHFFPGGWPESLRERHIMQSARHLASFEADGVVAYAYIFEHKGQALDDIEDAYLKLSISPHHRLRQKAGDRPILDVKLPLPKEETDVKSAAYDLYELAKDFEQLHADVVDLWLESRELTDEELEQNAKTQKTTVDEILVNGVPMTGRSAKPSDITFEQYWKEVQSVMNPKPRPQTRWPKDPKLLAVAKIMRAGGVFHQNTNPGNRRLYRVGLIWNATDQESEYLRYLDDLQWIELNGGLISDMGLSNLSGLTNLKKLVLRNVALKESGLKFLSSLTNLRELECRPSEVPTFGERDFANLRRLAQLEKLQLFNCEVTDDGLACLAKLEHLQIVNAQGTQVTDAGLAHLKQLQGLRVLNLFGTDCTDEGLAHLSGLEKLEELDVSSRHITNSGLVHLKRLKSLRDLDLRFTQVSDNGLEHLRGLTNLRCLDVGHSRVTSEGASKIKESLPQLEVKLD